MARVQMTPPSFTLGQDQTKTFTAVGLDASDLSLPGRAITWTSSDETVATVNAQGVVTAVGVGSATITAQVEGAFATAAVNTWSCPGQAMIPATECQAIIDLYGAVNREDWRSTPDWVPNPNPCDWA